MAKLKVGTAMSSLGDYLREQRVGAQLSLRQLAEQAGVSNPYLSQIERGLRKPSAEVLQQLAKALRISAEQLYVHAGILTAENEQRHTVERAILNDPVLTERQKRTMLEVYHAFRDLAVAESAVGAEVLPDVTSVESAQGPPEQPAVIDAVTATQTTDQPDTPAPTGGDTHG